MDLVELQGVLDRFAILDPQMPLHFLQTFLVVARRDSVTYREI